MALWRIDLKGDNRSWGLPGPKFCRNSGSPLRIAGIYGEGTSSSSFLGYREGSGSTRATPARPALPGILLKGVLPGVPGGFPLASLDSITRSHSLKRNASG